MLRNKRLFPVVVVGLLVALGTWLARDRDAEGPAPLAEDEARTDAYVRGATVLSADAAGNWQYELRSPRMAHYPVDGVWILTAPEVTFFRADGPDWGGHAEQGRVWDDRDEAELIGDVELDRPAAPDMPWIEVRTRDLRIQPERGYAETAAPTQMRQPSGTLSGTGARFYLNEERIELLSNVKGHYEPVP